RVLRVGLGDLLLVPEDDALVEHGGVATAAARARAAARQLRRLRARFRGLVELLLRVVDRRQPVVGLGEVRLHLDGLLVRLLGVLVVLLARVDRADVGEALGALRDVDGDLLELRDRLVVLARIAERDGLVELGADGREPRRGLLLILLRHLPAAAGREREV